MTDDHPRTLDAFTDPKRRQELADHLAAKVLPAVKKELRLFAESHADEWGVEPDLLQAWAATVMKEGADVTRQWQAGECEAHGRTLREIAAACETGGAGHVRRRMPAARQFAEARKAVDLTGSHVPVSVGNFRIIVTPVTPDDNTDINANA